MFCFFFWGGVGGASFWFQKLEAGAAGTPGAAGAAGGATRRVTAEPPLGGSVPSVFCSLGCYPVAQWSPRFVFSPFFWGEGFPLKSTQKRMPCVSHGHWASGLEGLFGFYCSYLTIRILLFLGLLGFLLGWVGGPLVLGGKPGESPG